MLRSRFRGLLVGVMAAAVLAVPAAPGFAAPSGPLKVMTRNLYLGADLTPTFQVDSFEELVQAVTTAWATVQATNFPERAGALADEIAETNPHIVGLQEVEIWRSQRPGDGPPPLGAAATTVEYDFLDILFDALADRGLHYEAVASVTNFDVEAPRLDFASPNFLQDIRLTDRDVIIARTDLPEHVFDVSNGRSGNFVNNLVLESDVLGSITLTRGWTAVDATTPTGTVRVVNTHLEPLHPLVQVAQGAELLAGPVNTASPVVLLGDLNSAADGSTTPTYGNILEAGFEDPWTERRGDDPGLTCCHAEDLLNTTATFTERIDFVLVRGGFGVGSVGRVGYRPEERTASGLWPSDHAGVWAVLLPG